MAKKKARVIPGENSSHAPVPPDYRPPLTPPGGLLPARATEPKYIEVMCIRTNRFLKTGKGQIGASDSETVRIFNRAKYLDRSPRGDFVIDLCDGDGDIADTYTVTEADLERILGEPAPTVMECIRYDREFWAQAQADYDARQAAGGQ